MKGHEKRPQINADNTDQKIIVSALLTLSPFNAEGVYQLQPRVARVSALPWVIRAR